MRARSLSLVLLALASAACASAPHTTLRHMPAEAPREGDAALADALDAIRLEHGLPGVAALRLADGAAHDMAAVGFRALPSRTQLSCSDRFHLGSDGKAMTATLAAVLIEAGVLPGWDAPLSVVFAGESIDPGLATITLAELASHRAGLPRDPEDLSEAERAQILAISDATGQRRVLATRELARPPASARGDFVYSNVGFMLLGTAIERAAGAPFETVMVEHLFTPLEMRSCSFSVPEGEGSYGHLPDGSLAGADTMIPLSYAPAGGVHCGLEDWSRFVIAHLRGESGGSTLLSAEAFRTLHTPAPGARYAFGWNVIEGPHGRRLLHAGSNGFWMALVRVDLDAGRALLFATNIGDVDLDALEPDVDALAR
jgi:CubicO group peptidase (beta-lactamase class C family)